MMAGFACNDEGALKFFSLQIGRHAGDSKLVVATEVQLPVEVGARLYKTPSFRCI